jgi:hypothetical protein
VCVSGPNANSHPVSEGDFTARRGRAQNEKIPNTPRLVQRRLFSDYHKYKGFRFRRI